MQDENAELYLVGRNAARLAEVQQDAKAFGDAAVHIIEVPPSSSTPFDCQPGAGTVPQQLVTDRDQTESSCMLHICGESGILTHILALRVIWKTARQWTILPIR